MKITIIGAGIAGLTTAIALKKAGIETEIFEAAPAIKPVGAGLGLAPNAMKALEVLGLANKVLGYGKELKSFRIADGRGQTITLTDSNSYQGEYPLTLSIHRHELHRSLLEELGEGLITINKKAAGIERQGRKITLTFDDGTKHETGYLVIADGINSQLRNFIMPDAKVRYSGYTCWRAVIKNPGLELNDEAVEYWGTKGRFGIVPSANNQVYLFACINAKARQQYRHYTIKDLQSVFNDFDPEVKSLLANTPNEALIYDDISDLDPLAKYAYDNILLIGDAAHATTPNMGQGACQAIEDAVVLMKEMQNSTSPEEAFIAFEKRRLKRTHFITKQSRSIGRLAQVSSPLLAGLRNLMMKMVPSSVQKAQLKKLYNVRF